LEAIENHKTLKAVCCLNSNTVCILTVPVQSLD